jgi:beta-RFAP synthase
MTDSVSVAVGARLHLGFLDLNGGLGSGTQLALAVAAALRKLHALPLDVEADALVLDRAARSGIGTGLFAEGGLVLDGGRGEGDRPAPIVARLPVPDEWHVLLVLDPKRKGAHGADEAAAFADLPPFSAELAGYLCRLVVMQALPAVAEADLDAFGHAVTEIQRRVGDYFAAAHGGRFTSPDVAVALDLLASNGVAGYGQSSWGPTGFAFAASRAEALRLRDLVAPIAAANDLDLEIARGRNGGAAIGEVAKAHLKGARHG